MFDWLGGSAPCVAGKVPIASLEWKAWEERRRSRRDRSHQFWAGAGVLGGLGCVVADKPVGREPPDKTA